MKIKYLFVGFIILSSVVLTGGFLFFPNLFSYESIAKTSSVWTDQTGAGISVPACGSSTPLVTCSGGAPNVTFTWAVAGPAPDTTVCSTASITAGPSGGPQSVIATGQPCTGGPFSWSGATLFNTTYTYSINFENGGHVISSGSFPTPGYCTAPAPIPPPTVSCSVAPTSATIGQNVTWTAVPSGGEAGAASGSINQSFESGNYAVWMTSGQDQTITARRFQATSAYWLKKVSLAFAREAALTGRLRVTIENDVGGLPSGNAIVGGTSDLVNVSGICVWGACATWIDFTFPGAGLTTGTNYWIVLRGFFDSTIAWSIIHWAGGPPDSNAGSKSLVRVYTTPSVWTDLTALGQDLWYRAYAANSPPSYSYSWSGDPPLAGQIVNPVNISYPSSGPKTGSVAVTSGGQSSGLNSCTNSVNVTGPPPPGDFTLSFGGSATCNSVPLSWTASSNADGYRILRGAPRVDISPYQPYTALNFTDTTVSQNTTYPYQIESYNISGTKRSNTINITTPFCPPTLTFSGSPNPIYQGQSTTLIWSTTFANACTASGAWSGSKAVGGSEIVFPSPPPSVTYNLQCSGPGGTTPVQPVPITITPFALPEWKEIIPR